MALACAWALASCAAEAVSSDSEFPDYPGARHRPSPSSNAAKQPPPDASAASRFPDPSRLEACGDTDEGFAEWLDAFREDAIAQGTPRPLATQALAHVVYDATVIELDRTQRPHAVTAETFAATHVTAARVKEGRRLLVEDADLFGRIEAQFGVAPEILVALWGLETDFGHYQGRTRSLDALATLAYDCRRAERFRGELRSALHILQRGDLTNVQMRGAWAGELGQTQFLPSSYETFGIDFDGDGRVDLLGSEEDALASTANYLAGHGWHPHEGYGPDSANQAVLASWNQSAVYRSAVVLFAQKLAARRG